MKQRGIFKTGLAIRGEQIQEIVPDWPGTMGWNPAHNLTADDWNQIEREELMTKMQRLLAAAKEIGAIGSPADLKTSLLALLEAKYPMLNVAGDRIDPGTPVTPGAVIALAQK